MGLRPVRSSSLGLLAIQNKGVEISPPPKSRSAEPLSLILTDAGPVARRDTVLAGTYIFDPRF